MEKGHLHRSGVSGMSQVAIWSMSSLGNVLEDHEDEGVKGMRRDGLRQWQQGPSLQEKQDMQRMEAENRGMSAISATS